MEKIAIIGVPSSAGARKTGQEGAPEQLRKAGLVEMLRRHANDVIDAGDLPLVRYSRDEDRPHEQNVLLATAVARQLSDRVMQTVAAGYKPFILGGDCTITIGAVSGLLNHYSDLALLYFDGDIDMNVPEDSPSGILDGMVLSHLIGYGNAELAHSGNRYPLLKENDVVAFGFNNSSGYIDPGESERFQKSAIHKFAVEKIQGRASSAASNALEVIKASHGAFLLHFDVDVLDASDFPAADVPHRNGMKMDDAREALSLFLADHALAGMVITEFNVERDPQQTYSKKLIEFISSALDQRSSRQL